MKALLQSEFGPPEVLHLAEIEKPVPKEGGVLVKVRAVSVNPLDWHFVRGEPRLLRMMTRPNGRIPGVDVAGQVEAVGANVTQLSPGDEVFGSCRGGFAEYVCSKESAVVRKPAALTYEQAAAIPIAGCTALQAVRDHGELRRGQSVLVNGAAGGVGTFAVQIAKALGAEVTGVCSTRNVDLVRSIGADHVVDYTTDDFTRSGRKYDLIVQVAGNRSAADQRRALAPRGILVIAGGGVGRDTNIGLKELMSAMAQMIGGRVFSRFQRQRSRMFLAKITKDDLICLIELVEAGKLTPVIDRSYPLADAAEAIRYLEGGHARGKVVVIP